MQRVLAILLLMALAGNAAAEWTILNKDANATTYIDKASVWRSGKTVKMWTMVDYTTPRDLGDGRSYLSYAALFEFDCLENKSRVLQADAFQGQMREGALMNSSTDSEWKYFPPGSVGAARQEIACRKS